MGYSEKDAQAPTRLKMTRKEIASAVEHIVSSVALEYGLVDGGDAISPSTKLHDDLGMDELDVMEVLFRAEKCFGNNLPDEIDPFSSLVSDIVDLVAEQVGQRGATYDLLRVDQAVRSSPFSAAVHGGGTEREPADGGRCWPVRPYAGK